MAHEFSHILNGDMRFNLRLIGILHGILFIGLGGQVLDPLRRGCMRRGGRRSPSLCSPEFCLRVQSFLSGFALYGIGSSGLFVGRWIRAAVSRQREYLADASASSSTESAGHDGGLEEDRWVGNAFCIFELNSAEPASHMFFERIRPVWSRSWFATHPPLADRIRAIDSAFDYVFPSGAPSALRSQSAGFRGHRTGAGRRCHAALRVLAGLLRHRDRRSGEDHRGRRGTVPRRCRLCDLNGWRACLLRLLTAVHEPFSALLCRVCLVAGSPLGYSPAPSPVGSKIEGKSTPHETERITGQLHGT